MPRNTRKRGKRRSTQENSSNESSPKVSLNPIEPKTVGQELFLKAIQTKPIVICDGPAGTGKTFISFASALRACIQDKDIERIVVVRPTITAGDEPSLGFLPGTLDDKMAPFIAPILKDTAPLLFKKPSRSAADNRFIERFGNGKDDIQNLLSKFDIEVVPLHLMRGRSFNGAFIILDEAQNCSMEDFKLFLTRKGRRSRIIIEGDASQKDRKNGALPELMARMQKLSFVGVVRMTEEDIIRDPLLADILRVLE